MATKTKKMSKPANNANLNYGNKLDQPAIKAVQSVAEILEYEFKDALRWVCVNMKSAAVDKAKQIQKLLKAS